jgi:hypothetical protein
MAKRGGDNLNLETRQALDHCIEIGRGGVWLELTEEQYVRLRKGKLSYVRPILSPFR